LALERKTTPFISGARGEMVASSSRSPHRGREALLDAFDFARASVAVRGEKAPLGPPIQRTLEARSDISEREVIVVILAHLGLPTEASAVARARCPAFELA
jgi:hypothetical protein